MRKPIAGLAVLLLCAPLALAAQSRPAAPSTAVAHLRRDYYAQDFSRVAEDGGRLLKQYPGDLELRAWYVVAAPYGADVPGIVAQMEKLASDSPWTLLASAAAASGFEEKIALCERSIAGARRNTDVLVLATDIVRQAALSDSDSQHPPNADALKKFLAEHKHAYKRSSNGLAAEAEALDTVAQIEKSTKSMAAPKLADRVLREDPTNVVALLLKSQILVKHQQYQANYDLLKTAAAAAPDSYALHMAYWKAVLTLPNVEPAGQAREILADAARILSAAEPSIQFTQTSLDTLHRASPDLATAFGDLLLKYYRHSGIEDAVLLNRATANETLTEEEYDAEISRLEAFISRPTHYAPELLHQANGVLVDDMIHQENPDLARLYQAELASPGETSDMPPEGIIALADRKFRLPDLQALARNQLDAQWLRFETIASDTSSSPGLVRILLGLYPGEWLDAAGWVEFQEGRPDAALPELEDASKLSPRDPSIAVHLGTAYEAKGDRAEAEKSFRNALSMPYSGEGDNPAIAALRKLYTHTHGGNKGLESYLKPILAEDAARRHAAILSERLKPEKPIPPFELALLGGKEVSSEGLKGKYLVLNFWATW